MTGHSSPKAPWLRTRRTQLRVQLPVVFQNRKQCPRRRRDEGNGNRYLRVYCAGQSENDLRNQSSRYERRENRRCHSTESDPKQ
jgi:hypothetical protein